MPRPSRTLAPTRFRTPARPPVPARLTALALCLLLAACGTPQDRCIASVTRDLRVVDRLIADTEANLARGYALVNQTVFVPAWDYCTGPVLVQPAAGGPPMLIPGQWCLDDDPVTVRRPVAIDPAAEKRKLAGLQDQRRKILARAEPAIAQCRASYPA
jgi:hypothetical protein